MHGKGEPSAGFALLALRVAGGAFLLPHALAKMTSWFGGGGIAGFQGELAMFGFPDAAPLAWALALSQGILGLLVALGAFTRPAAFAAAVYLGMTVALNAGNGWFWMGRGIEYPLMWTMVLVAVGLLGPGQFSIDRVLDR